MSKRTVQVVSPGGILSPVQVGLIDGLADCDTVVIVALDLDQAEDVYNGNKDAGWICVLQNRMAELIESGSLKLVRSWEVSGRVTLEIPITARVEACDREGADKAYRNFVDDNLSGLVDISDAETEDIDVDDIEEA
jgi:hypothetical protein